MNTFRVKRSQRCLDVQAPERLLDAVQRLHRQRTAEDIATVLVDEAAALCGAQRVMVALDTAPGLQVAAMRLPAGEVAATLLHAITPWLTEARRTRKARLRHGPQGAEPQDQRSCLVVPLVVAGGAIGHLYADIDGARGRFDGSHLRVLGRLAVAAAVMLEHAQAIQGLAAQVTEGAAELTNALEQQTATSKVLEVISSSVADAQPVLEKILESCRHLFDADSAGVLLIGDDGLLHLAAWRTFRLASFMQDWPQTQIDAFYARARSVFPMKAAGSAAEFAIKAGGVLNFPDVLHGDGVPDSVRVPAQRAAMNYSQMIAPMLLGAAGIGTITLMRARLGGFTDKEQALLKTFGDQAVIAIQNAKMFRETNEALERQTATAEVLRVISSSVSDTQQKEPTRSKPRKPNPAWTRAWRPATLCASCWPRTTW